MERSSGERPPELDGEECPESLIHVFEWFIELDGARGSNGFGQNPISYGEIADWSRLTGRQPTPFEVDCIRGLDRVLLTVRSKK